MGLILDTSVLIDSEQRGLPFNSKSWAQDEAVYISVITVSELLVGVHKATTKAQRVKRSAFVEYILSILPALIFDADVARIHAQMCAELPRGAVGAHDRIIAATAIAYGYGVVTANSKEFKRVHGLVVNGVRLD